MLPHLLAGLVVLGVLVLPASAAASPITLTFQWTGAETTNPPAHWTLTFDPSIVGVDLPFTAANGDVINYQIGGAAPFALADVGYRFLGADLVVGAFVDGVFTVGFTTAQPDFWIRIKDATLPTRTFFNRQYRHQGILAARTDPPTSFTFFDGPLPAVPEPSILLLLGAGLAAAGLRRRLGRSR